MEGEADTSFATGVVTHPERKTQNRRRIGRIRRAFFGTSRLRSPHPAAGFSVMTVLNYLIRE